MFTFLCSTKVPLLTELLFLADLKEGACKDNICINRQIQSCFHFSTLELTADWSIFTHFGCHADSMILVKQKHNKSTHIHLKRVLNQNRNQMRKCTQSRHTKAPKFAKVFFDFVHIFHDTCMTMIHMIRCKQTHSNTLSR